MRILYEKAQSEDQQRKERRAKGKADLDKWSKQRQNEISQRGIQNIEVEKNHHAEVKAQREGAVENPWGRVVS